MYFLLFTVYKYCIEYFLNLVYNILEGQSMVMKKIALLLVLAGSMTYAMDMARVNALAEQIKNGEVVAPESMIHNQNAMHTDAKLQPAQSASQAIPKTIAGAVTEESLGLRKKDLYSEDQVALPPVKYTDAAPGTAKRFDRSYENAPPLIPHSVDGLLPITKNNNACLGCHMPDVAKSMGATPIPPSHFTNFRPMTKLDKEGRVTKEGIAVANTSDIKIVARQEKKLYPGRFNCSQCHVPQANVKPLVKNTFKPDYRSADEKHKSNLMDVINEGVE